MTENRFGILGGKRNNVPIPLTGVEINGIIIGRSAKVICRQKFHNAEDNPIECIYKFPLPESAAACGFQVIVGNRILKGCIEERNKAISAYEEAIDKSYGSYLLSEERPNIFTLSIGNMPPHTSAMIEISYVTLLDATENEIRFFLPTTISPRYIPDGKDVLEWMRLDKTLIPEFRLDVPYGIKIEISIYGRQGIKVVHSPSHQITSYNEGNKIKVGLVQETTKMDRDFILTIISNDEFHGGAFLSYIKNNYYIHIDFIPEILANKTLSINPAAREFIFLLDCSGSMDGSSINEAKKAIEIMVRALDENTCFNIFRFGSKFDRLFPAPLPYEQTTLKRAMSFLSRTKADKGGTEILAPLENIYQSVPRLPSRDIVLITDGEVGNEEELILLASNNKKHTRLHMLAIGYGPNEYFIKELARATDALADMISPDERIELKALKMFQKILNGPLGAIRFLGNASMKMVPKPPLTFYGDPVPIFVKLNGRAQIPENIHVLKSQGNDGMIWDLSFLQYFQRDTTDELISVHRIEGEESPLSLLWAREKIREWEAKLYAARLKNNMKHVEALEKSLINISKEYGLICSLTSFIAIEERDDNQTEIGNDNIIRRGIPVILSHDWGNLMAPIADYCMTLAKNTIGEDALYQLVIEEEIELSERSANCLRKAGILTIGDLVQKTEKELLSMSNFGKKSLAEIQLILAEMGLELGTQKKCADKTNISKDIERENLSMKREDKLLAILAYQQAGGGFAPHPRLLQLLRINDDQIKSWTNKMSPIKKVELLPLAITAIVINLLHEYFQDQKDYWERIVRKSEDWLNKQIALYRPVIAGVSLEKWARNHVKTELAD